MQKAMGTVIPIHETPLQKTIRKDFEANKDMAKRLEEYWARLGHEVHFQVLYDPVLQVHSIKTDDLGTNGLPKEQLTSIARRNLLNLK